jgi:ribonuclease HI
MYQINLYLETSIKGVKKGIGWYGYLLEYVDRKGNLHTIYDFKYETDVTPNMLQLMVFCAALNRITQDSEITVFTESAYLSGGYIKYLQEWKSNGWKTAKGEPLKNKNLWQQVDKLTDRHVVRFDKTYHHGYKNWMVSEITRRKAGGK